METHRLLEEYNLDINPSDRVSSLGVGQKQMVEIAKALSKKAKLLVLDEPTSALSDNEIEQLHAILRVVRSRGVTCIYVSHRLQEFFDLTDRVTVLRDGAVVETHDIAQLTMAKLISAMVGRPMTKRFPDMQHSVGDVVLSVRDLEVGDHHNDQIRYVKHADFDLRSGEVLGIAGLMGSGRTELANALIGELGYVMQGEVAIDGHPRVLRSAREAMQAGILLVPENRKEQGLVLIQSILHNISLPNLDQFSAFMRINGDQELAEANKFSASLAIKAPNMLTIVNNLSGGNQQKVIIAKTLMALPKVLILDDPTRGIDVGAKFEIYTLINRLAAEGVAILLISSELEEVIGMSDRILVIHEYQTVCSLDPEDFNQETIMGYATGVRTAIRGNARSINIMMNLYLSHNPVLSTRSISGVQR